MAISRWSWAVLGLSLAGCGPEGAEVEPSVAAVDQAFTTSDDGIGAQARPDLSFASIPPVTTYHVALNGSDSNPGTAERPWRTIGKAARTLTAGQGAYVHGGVYYERVITGNDGTATAPIHLMAAPGEVPVIKGGDGKSGAMLRITRRYWVVSGFKIDAAGSHAHGVRFEGARNVVVKGCEIFGGTGPGAVPFYDGAQDIGFLSNKVHHYTWGTRDSHAMYVLPDTARILIQGNESWANGGDSFQCMGPDVTSGTNLATDITVEGNRFHEDRENAIDIKTCDRVTIRNNKFYGYRPASTAPQGAAVVIHMSARRILMEGNRIWDSGRGLSLGGVMVWNVPVTDVIVRRNLVFEGTTASGGTGDGLRVGTSRRVRLYHNTLAKLPTGAIRVGDGDNGPAEATEVFNNIMWETPRALDVNRGGVSGFVSDRNVAFNSTSPISFRINGSLVSLATWQGMSGQDLTTMIADPLFVDDPRNNDYFTKAGSPARDRALPAGGSLCGSATDVGFLESCF